MRYFIIEGSPDGAFNATNKAREDVEVILKREGIEPFHINTVSGIQKNKLMKWKQFLDYKKNYRTWDKALSEFKEGDMIYIQYPILNTAWKVKKLFKKYKEKGIKFVAIIHDLNSLRLSKEENGKFLYNRVCDDDKYILNEMDYIICHNASMKKVLVNLGNDPKRIIELKLFDYLIVTYALMIITPSYSSTSPIGSSQWSSLTNTSASLSNCSNTLISSLTVIVLTPFLCLSLSYP